MWSSMSRFRARGHLHWVVQRSEFCRASSMVGEWLRRLDPGLERLVFCGHEVEVVHRGQAGGFHFTFLANP